MSTRDTKAHLKLKPTDTNEALAAGVAEALFIGRALRDPSPLSTRDREPWDLVTPYGESKRRPKPS